MTSTPEFLASIARFVEATRAPSSAARPVRLAVVSASYASGYPTVTFEGESTESTKGYPYLSSYTPAASDRVVMVPVGSTYLIIGAVASP